LDDGFLCGAVETGGVAKARVVGTLMYAVGTFKTVGSTVAGVTNPSCTSWLNFSRALILSAMNISLILRAFCRRAIIE
jgi:hypothetical protein